MADAIPLLHAIDIQSLDHIKRGFTGTYISNGNSKRYLNILFEYQNRIMQAGHLESLQLMNADERRGAGYRMAES